MRRDARDNQWYRGLIVNVVKVPHVLRSGEVGTRFNHNVRVFLVDYGKYWNNLAAYHCVREIPEDGPAQPKPLATLVYNAWLKPVAIDFNYARGGRAVNEAAAAEWGPAAHNLVKVRELW